MTAQITSTAPLALECRQVAGWPKLSWVATATDRLSLITVWHGPCVESGDGWCAEAVWDGRFVDGDFDRTDVVVGTGVRVRGADVMFVSASDALSRLHWWRQGSTLHVSNSLPALLEVAKIDLVEDFDYAGALATIVDGLISCRKELPSSGGPIYLTYFHNLRFAHGEVEVIAKPSKAPDFVDFATYRDFLSRTARRLGHNAADPARGNAVVPMATVSSGYDSAATAVIARDAGARRAATIVQARRDASNLFSTNDSGEAVAEQLGLQCTTHARQRTSYPLEDAAWAGIGNVGDINLAMFDQPQPLCILFTGFMGDVLWGPDTEPGEPLQRKDTSGARFSEARLDLGMFICTPVLWGCQKDTQILRLSHLPEMQPWRVGGHYDRPVPRRLIEEAGVRRGTFAVRKRVASFNRPFGRPLSADLRADFADFLARRGRRPGSRLSEVLALLLAGIDWVVLARLPRAVRFSCKHWVRLPSPSLFFLWANERLRRRYRQAMHALPPPMPVTGDRG